jgi:hypothetical protein
MLEILDLLELKEFREMLVELDCRAIKGGKEIREQ